LQYLLGSVLGEETEDLEGEGGEDVLEGLEGLQPIVVPDWSCSDVCSGLVCIYGQFVWLDRENLPVSASSFVTPKHLTGGMGTILLLLLKFLQFSQPLRQSAVPGQV